MGSSGMKEVVTDDDLLIEILHRIPCLKSAIQCQSVCKQWRSLISSNFFQNRFRERHQSNFDQTRRGEDFTVKCCKLHVLLMVPPPMDVFSFEFSLDFIGQEWCVAGSFYGFLLYAKGEYWHNLYMICNPITKQSVTLPPAPISGETKMGTVFLGFACDDSFRTFKVVRLVALCGRITSVLRVCVFSSETGQWSHSMVSTPTPMRWPSKPSPAVHHGGWLLWGAVDWKYTIVYDIHNSKFVSIVDPPEDGDGQRSDGLMLGLGLCCGAVCIAQLRTRGYVLKIWQLNEQPKWSLKRMVKLQECIVDGRQWLLGLWLIAIHPYDCSIVYLGLDSGKILCCNLKTSTIKLTSECNCDYKSDPMCEHHLYLWKDTYHLCFPLWPPPVPQYNTSQLN
ncbi:F-box protein At3g26010-like [Mercurialis annua]|uniref:F-box protein At3g26010-like n=1 Tax=Mercurialis annua TaxID=3986 RepID=UPI0021608222|nr:F-box protein At3g26010-like [Mercurialis annua]